MRREYVSRPFRNGGAVRGLEEGFTHKHQRSILSPEIVERILRGDETERISLAELRTNLPVVWAEQGRASLPLVTLLTSRVGINPKIASGTSGELLSDEPRRDCMQRYQALQDDDPNTLACTSDLALGCQDAEKFDLTLPLDDVTRKLTKPRLGNDHADTFHSTNNLAAASCSLRQLGRPVPRFEALMPLIEKKHGRGHTTGRPPRGPRRSESVPRMPTVLRGTRESPHPGTRNKRHSICSRSASRTD